jgi:hypothetical protein
VPLNKSGTPEARSQNIAELRHSGYPLKQSIAIAYSVEREHEHPHKERHHHEKNKYGR